MRTLLTFCACAFLLVGCGSKENQNDGGGCHNEDHGHDGCGDAHHHAHDAPMGGDMVELGSHEAQFEIVANRKLGILTAYIWDGHAQSAIRIEAPKFEALATYPDGTKTVTFMAMQKTMTGEKPGDSATFSAADPVLKAATRIRIAELKIRDATYKDIIVTLK